MRDRLVHVWWADLRAADMTAAERLPASERARLDEVDDQAARGRRLVGELLLQLAVRAARGLPDGALVDIDRTCAECRRQHGRPRVADGGGPHLSVAHAGTMVAVATCAGDPVGIDVERADVSVAVDAWVVGEARVKAGLPRGGDGGDGMTVALAVPLRGYSAAVVVAGGGRVQVVEHLQKCDVDHVSRWVEGHTC